MTKSLMGLVAGILAAMGGAPHASCASPALPAACGIKMSLPQGWTLHPGEAGPEGCDLELRPPGWRQDPDCPERLNGRLYVRVVPKQMHVFLGRAQQEWLRSTPGCDSGWSAQGEGGVCLQRIDGRASALSGEANVRLYCNGTYAGQNEGTFGVVFGEERLVLVIGDVGDVEIFDRIVGSMRPR
jgi:hypothetical protein